MATQDETPEPRNGMRSFAVHAFDEAAALSRLSDERAAYPAFALNAADQIAEVDLGWCAREQRHPQQGRVSDARGHRHGRKDAADPE